MVEKPPFRTAVKVNYMVLCVWLKRQSTPCACISVVLIQTALKLTTVALKVNISQKCSSPKQTKYIFLNLMRLFE